MEWTEVRAKDKDRRQRKREKGAREKGEEMGYVAQRDKGLPLVRKETDVVHEQMVVYKGTRANSVLG